MILIPGAEPPVPSDERIAACVKACNGLSTEQLKAMNAIEPGMLAIAYNVCSQIWQAFHIEYIGQHSIDGHNAIEVVQEVGEEVEAVVSWGRETGAEP